MATLDNTGDVYAGGAFRTYRNTECGGLVRLNMDGSLDTAFAVGDGFAAAPNDCGVEVLCPSTDGSGDLYVGGSFTLFNGQGIGRIIRLNADGSADANFNAGAGFTGGPTAAVLGIVPALDGSGDIYVRVDGVQQYQGAAVGAVVRLNADGSRDTAFATGAGFGGGVGALATVPGNSGDILVAGPFTSYAGAAIAGLVRLNADGSIDTALTPPPNLITTTSVRGWFVDPIGGAAGAFYFASPSSNGCILRRLTADGAIDPSFQSGISNQVIYDIAQEAPTGDVWIAGAFTSYTGAGIRNHILRLNADGTVDASFDPGFGFSNTARALVPLADGDVLVAGDFSSYGWTAGTSGLCRINGDGTFDVSFQAGSGFDFGPWTASFDGVYAVAMAADGSGDVYAGGNFLAYGGTPTQGLVRINADGTRDAAFAVGAGINGSVRRVTTIVPTSGGDVFVGGQFTTYNGAPTGSILRLNADGSIDPAFFMNNTVGFVYTMAAVGDGTTDLYVAGSSIIIRISADGTQVGGAFGTFGGGGGAVGVVLTILPALDGTGDVYVGGAFTSCNGVPVQRLVRLNANGTIDPGFVCALQNAGGQFFEVRALERAGDGSGDVYVGGMFRICNGVPVNEIIRLNADGTLDAAFDTGPVPAGFSAIGVHAVRMAGDGSTDLYVAGTFQQIGSVSANRIARLNADGSPDAGFASGAGLGARAFALAVAPGGGELYVGGEFRYYADTTASCLAGVNADGSVD